MFLESEARRSAKGLSDLIDYESLVADGIARLSSGVYIAAWGYQGNDLDALSLDEAFATADRLARQFSLGAGWSLQCDLVRSEQAGYIPESTCWPEPVSLLVEEERRARFLIEGSEGATMRSRYFFSLSYEPNERGIRAAARQLIGIAEEKFDESSDVILDRFQKKVADIDAALGRAVKTLKRLKGYLLPVGASEMHCDGLLEYLRLCVTGDYFPFAVPSVPIDLNQYIASDDFVGGALPQLGDPLDYLLPGNYIRVLAVDSFPDVSFAGILRQVDALPFTFRFSQQARILDDREATKLHDENKSKWRFRGSGGLKGKLKSASVDLDGTALDLAGDAIAAKSAAEHGREVFCSYSSKVILLGRDLAKLRDASRAIAAKFRHSGFGTRVETINAVAAWLGSMPGQQYKDPRMFTVNTVNLTHMIPLSQPWLGSEFNPSPYFAPKSPPLLCAVTAGGSKYHLNCHVQDIGHTLVVGPSGAGKTSLIGLSMLQAFRYPDAQVFAFDKKQSLYTLARSAGAAYINLSPDEEDSGLCPLADLSGPMEVQWAEQWVAMLAGLSGLNVNPALSSDIRRAVKRLAMGSAARSITTLHMACDSQELKQALDFYRGTILDGQRDTLRMSRFVVFEMDRLYNLDQRIMNGALFFIFAKIRKRLRSDVPTFMFVDEFRAALSHPLAAAAFRDYLLEGRKLNLAVWLVVQELQQTMDSPLKSAVLEQCMTTIALPNAKAMLDSRPAYAALGANAADIAAIASSTPKSEYYVMQESGNRLVSLQLGRVMLALLKSGDKDRATLDALITRLGHHRGVSEWLRLNDAADWADRFKVLAGIGQKTAEEAVLYA
jgi:type IV secretion system protein VirB4